MKKKGLFISVFNIHTFLTIPECALRHSQPLQHCHLSRDNSFSYRDLCTQAQMKAFTPLLIKLANELQIVKIFVRLFPTFVLRNADLIIHL